MTGKRLSEMSTKKPQSKVWAWVGKVSVLIAVLTGLLVLYDRLFTKTEYNINAQGEFFSFVLPQPLVEGIGDKAPSLKKVNTYFAVSVQNQGDKEISEMNLEIPGDGYYSIRRPGQEVQRGDFKRTIPIGSLRPSNSLEVEVWAEYLTVYNYDEDYEFVTRSRARITHPNGVAQIDFPMRASGTWKWIYDKSLPLVFALFVVLVFALLLNNHLSRELAKLETAKKEIPAATNDEVVKESPEEKRFDDG